MIWYVLILFNIYNNLKFDFLFDEIYTKNKANNL